MAVIVIAEFMDSAAVAALSAKVETFYAADLVDRPEVLRAALADARALIVRNRTRVDADLLAAAPRLERVGRLGVGLDNIDLPACAARGIAVHPATGANDDAVAEYVAAAALILLRPAFLATEGVLAGNWPRNQAIGRELAGKTAGLVGFGGTARKTAARLAALRMRIVAHDPVVDPGIVSAAGVVPVALEALLAGSDLVSLHVPLTAGTRHLIDHDRIASMPRGAVLVNASRGGVVDEEALMASLRSGHLGGAALDVFEREPLTAETGAAFRDVPNLILTPHIAGVTIESNERVSALIAEIMIRELGLT